MTTYLGKSCSFCLPRVPFVNCRQFMYLVISLLVLRAGYGIWLYPFLIIAYLFTLINLSIRTSIFPDYLKRAQVAPLHKKNDPMDKTNFWPVSVLTTTSKLYENILSEQLSLYFDDIFYQYLCGFRKGHGCQTTLLRLLEDWRGPWTDMNMLQLR